MKKVRSLWIALFASFVFIMPIAVKANNYFYNDTWTTIEYKDTSSGSRYTYSTRYAARQANVCSYIKANTSGKTQSNCGYQDSRAAINEIKQSHTHNHWVNQ